MNSICLNSDNILINVSSITLTVPSESVYENSPSRITIQVNAKDYSNIHEAKLNISGHPITN